MKKIELSRRRLIFILVMAAHTGAQVALLIAIQLYKAGYFHVFDP